MSINKNKKLWRMNNHKILKILLKNSAKESRKVMKIPLIITSSQRTPLLNMMKNRGVPLSKLPQAKVKLVLPNMENLSKKSRTVKVVIIYYHHPINLTNKMIVL
jgi:hypothetical protein